MATTMFGRYELRDLLGAGGMGQVFRAYDTATDRIVALKMLPPHLAEDERFQTRFRREAHAAAGLNEPHVVPIHNFGEIDGRLYVDMRLIEGSDLHKVLARGPLAPARAVMVIEQIAAALEAAHRIGLVHRDVKPSNILLADRDFAYLIDFGIARGTDDTRVTGTGLAAGTLAYMAPERLNTGRADARSDIYGLTCVLHESLTGRPPFPGGSLEQQIAGHLVTQPPRPSTLQPTVPIAFDQVIATGMAKDPRARYQTASDLAAAARAALATSHRPAAINPPANQAPTRPVYYSHPSWAPTQYGTTPPSQQQLAAPLPPPPSRRKRTAAKIAVITAVALAVIAVTAFTTFTRPDKTVTIDIDKLLVDRAEVRAITGESGLILAGHFDKLIPDTSEVDPEICHSAAYVAGQGDYASTNWMAMREDYFAGSGDFPPSVDEAVFRFPSAARAKEFLETSARDWQQCVDKPITSTSEDSSDVGHEIYSDFKQDANLIALIKEFVPPDAGADKLICQHAVAIASNYVADVNVCAERVTDQAESIARRILRDIP